jgi:hypothetical protein
MCSASEFERCPQDCLVEAVSDLPLYVLIYYHVEPNPQLFESVEPGYFEAVSLSIREMSSSLAGMDVHATFCFAWLYNDLVHCRNRAQTGDLVNSPQDTGIETFEQVVADGHEVAYHTHPPAAIQEGNLVYYARPDAACQRYDVSNRHRWTGPSPDERLVFYPGVYRFDDPADPWYDQFTWERTAESLFLIADHVGTPVRHTNGGQRPLLDVANELGSGVNHEDGIAQIRSLMDLGFDLLSPEIMPYFHTGHAPEAAEWTDFSTAHAAYFGPENNVQVYYPAIDRRHLEWGVSARQGLTFMPAQREGQLGWKGVPDDRYYDPRPLGTGYGGIRWSDDNFYLGHGGEHTTPWSDAPVVLSVPSMANQFNSAMQRHLDETPRSVNAWGFNFHIVNVMRADLSGLSDNWDKAVSFYRDIADGLADGVINEPRRDLVQFVTMQGLSEIYDAVVTSAE